MQNHSNTADVSLPESTRLGDWALYWAARGFAVLGLLPRDKHPAWAHGHLSATTDLDAIRRWWFGSRPDLSSGNTTSNIGGRVPDGWVVLDEDVPGTIAALEQDLGPLPTTRVHRSGREGGGRHQFYRLPEGCRPGASPWPGVDVKTSRGYVLLPPSIHPDTGHAYRIEVDTWEIAELPDAWAQALSAGQIGASTTGRDGVHSAELGDCPWPHPPETFGAFIFARCLPGPGFDPTASRHSALMRGVKLAYHQMWGPTRAVALASLERVARQAGRSDTGRDEITHALSNAAKRNAAGAYGIIDTQEP